MDAVSEFFERLNERGFEPLLDRVQGSVRFDLRSGRKLDRWLLTVDRGNVHAAREGLQADCVVATDRATFEAMASGRANPMAAMLRGAVEVSGRVDALVYLQRVFPGPPGAKGPRRQVEEGAAS